MPADDPKTTANPFSTHALAATPAQDREAPDPSTAVDALWLEDVTRAQTADSLRQRAATLLQGYLRAPSRQLAEQLGACFASLAWHPEVCRDPRCHCAYRGLVRHWFWLAGSGGCQPG
ncbi:hypothetical protein Thiowin_02095 [Thiorhodovibrio winogradskyi]|uniref:Uncharacterized protein n=1 Tax=Thiorhodovibrio winogradskyi TaxID=77007 RepID=A0ABZ0S9J3_9GAMM|nr:hypothetical protein [Thiorhodovibrio winogradskyi]